MWQPHTVETTVTKPLEGMPFNSLNIWKYLNSFYVRCCAIRLPTFFPTKKFIASMTTHRVFISTIVVKFAKNLLPS